MKLKLDTDEMAEEFFEDTALLGVVAPVKDYQFCWQLNQLLQYDFRINHDLEIQLFKKQRNYYFGIYQYAMPTGTLTHYIYNNQFDGEYLLPEFKHLDFLWLLKGDIASADYIGELIATVREINGVQLVLELNGGLIRNKSHLIF